MIDASEEVIEALRAIRAEAHRLEDPEHRYPMVSVRSLAEKLGYAELIPSILTACVSGGFTYCLDATIPGHTGERPSQDVCYWGPDQLRSRLDSIDYRVYTSLGWKER